MCVLEILYIQTKINRKKIICNSALREEEEGEFSKPQMEKDNKNNCIVVGGGVGGGVTGNSSSV